MLDIFRPNTRTIEGLSAHLVVALIAGVTSMSVMLNMLSGVQGLATSELDVRPIPDVVGPDEQTLNFTVIDHEGSSAEGTTVIVKSGIAKINSVATAKSDDGGSATADVDAGLGTNREDGTLVVSVKSPAGESFVDRRENTNVLVVQD